MIKIMSKLLQLNLMGVRSFGPETGDEQEIIFTSPVTLFLGNNGCGKTSIIEALRYVISGDLPAGAKDGQGFLYDPQMTGKDESRGQVKLSIQNKDKQLVTVKKISTVMQSEDKQTIENIDSILLCNNVLISKRTVNVHKEIFTLLGVPEPILNYVVFCHQQDSYWPVEEPDKLKLIETIFDSSKYNKSLEKMIQVKNIKLKSLESLETEVERKKLDVRNMESKKHELLHIENRYKRLQECRTQLDAEDLKLQKELETLQLYKKNVDHVNHEISRIMLDITNKEEEQNDILSNIHELDCSDEELNVKISSFESCPEMIRRKIKLLDDDINEIKDKENKLTNDISEEQVNLNKLQAELEENDNEILTKNRLIEESISDFDINIDLTINTEDIISTFKEYLKYTKLMIENFELLSDTLEKNTENQNDYNRNLSQLETERQEEIDNQLEQIETQLTQTENQITEMESQINITELQGEIQNEKIKLSNLEKQFDKADKELKILLSYRSLQIETDLYSDILQKKQNELQKLLSSNENNLSEIFENEIPENNLKFELEKYLKNQTENIDEVNKKIREKEKKLAIMEANVMLQKEKLGIMRKDLEKDSLLVIEYFQDLPFERVQSEASRSINALQNTKGMCVNSVNMYSAFLKSFKQINPYCPLCTRDLQRKDSAKSIIKEIEKKINSFPEKQKTIEMKLEDAQNTYKKICELKSCYYKVQQVRKQDMSILIQKISEADISIKKTTEDLYLLRKSIESPQNGQELARNLMNDAVLMDQYNKEIDELRTLIISTSLLMPTIKTNRTVQEALNEQEHLKFSVKTVHFKIEELYNTLNKHYEILDIFKSRLNILKAKKFNIEKNYEYDKNQLETEVNNVSEIKDRNVNSTIENKREIMVRRSKVNKSKTKLEEIITLRENINNFIKLNVVEKISTINKKMEEYKQQLQKCLTEKDILTKHKKVLKDQIVAQECLFLNLLANKESRDNKKQLEALQIKLEKYKSLQEQFIPGVDEKIRLLTDLLAACQLKINNYKEHDKDAKTLISLNTAELSKPIYVNAINEFNKKSIERIILSKAIEDLDTFMKGLDWVMLQYNQKQIKKINNTIKELWHSVYEGNDIDYIKIKIKIEENSRNENRVVYNYHLVQAKNNVEFDMKRCCSAGQKALASLIVRIALIDIYSANCGILALDEPTTNLDRENIESFCRVLCELIERKKQQNFQLVIVTHDREFLERLSCKILINKYYLICKNDEGKSVVVIKDNYLKP